MANSNLKLEPIPQPKPRPFVGNVPDIETSTPVQSFMELQRQYGPIFRFERPGGSILIVSSQELVNEICDETRFEKNVHSTLKNIRDFTGDGLFTAFSEEPNWAIAHRILMPAFGPAALREMFPAMVDIADQLMKKWERIGSQVKLDVVDNMTRLTLDTIGLCAFDYRFNSFYEREMHPFIDAMVRGLAESGARTRRLALQNKIKMMTDRQYADDIKYMHAVADELIQERKRDPEGPHKKDLLNRMLQGKDSVTGKTLSDENMRFQLVTFLIAGHETTSGMLSFATHLMLKHPEVLAKAREEADRVFGEDEPRFEHISKLVYMDQILKEALRIWPTAPAFALNSKEDTVIGGKYAIKKNEILMVLAPALHRDPKVWADPETFDPDRFSSANLEKIPTNAWKPFGNGQRSCIGRPFAMQEACLVLGLLLNKFDVFEADPSYQLQVKETLTLKPEGLFIRVKRREGTRSKPNASLSAHQATVSSTLKKETSVLSSGSVLAKGSLSEMSGTQTPLLVLYGSNGGSSEAFANKIALESRSQGYAPQVAALDEKMDQLQGETLAAGGSNDRVASMARGGSIACEKAVVIVTSSYEGQPPDNAKNFVAWLENLEADTLKNIRYTVFGCGNKDWVRTYQAVPKRIDLGLERAGAKRLQERGEADARGDFFGDFENWYETLWKNFAKEFNKEVQDKIEKSFYEIEEVTNSANSLIAQNGLNLGRVVANVELVNMSSPLGRSKRHIEIHLPEGQSYQSGDYLAVLPENPPLLVDRVLHHFGFSKESQILVRSAADEMSIVPTGKPVLVCDLLARYVELAVPATQKQIFKMANSNGNVDENKALNQWVQSSETFKQIIEKRFSVMDLLEKFPNTKISFATFLEMLSPMKPRQYSISSSPLWKETACTITVALVDVPAWSGVGRFQGVCSNFLNASRPGSLIAVATRISKGSFHLPKALNIPIIMVGAGTGLAPFRGFIQERFMRLKNGEVAGPALLFFGCDHPDVDFIYRTEMDEWQNAGAVQVRPTFFKQPEDGIQFVQDRLWKERKEVMGLIDQGGHVYVCGDGKRMAPAVRDTFSRMYQEVHAANKDQAQKWFGKLEESIRYVEDVFG